MPMVNAIAMHPTSASLVGQLAVVLAGIAGAALIVTTGLRLGRPPASPAVPTATGRPAHDKIASWARSLAALRDTIGRRSHPVVAAAAALAAGLAASVLIGSAAGLLTRAGPIVRLDRPVDRFVDAHRLAAVVHVMLNGTLLGSYVVVYTIAVVTGLVVGVRTRRWLPLVVLVASVPAEIVIQKLTSSLVHGTKPAQALAIGAPGGYFSGGSARTLIVFGLVAYFAGWTGMARTRRAALWTVAVLATFAEGYSRLYLGRHWAVDIVGGWLLGALILASFIFAAEVLRPAVDEKAGVHRMPPGAALPEARAREGALASPAGTEIGL